jgi:asparagine synthase (glutamine-hydrolysing)
MFAFAAFDVASGSLVLAVDRFGQKPLVWTLLPGGRLAFASELGALRRHPDVARGWDPLAVCRFLAFDVPPAPQTMLRGVFRLEPATALVATLDAEGSVLSHRVFRWWEPGFARDGAAAPSQDDFVGALRLSVKRHLVADVPLGVLLSGGIDSTAVAMAAAAERPIVTLSMGFDDEDYDEAAPARETARLLGTEHHEFQLTAREALEAFDQVVSHLDEPLADAGCLPAWALYRKVRGLVTVAVGGDGGDELLEGYPTFRALALSRRLDTIGSNGWASALQRSLEGAAKLFPVGEGYYPFGYQLRRFAAGLKLERWQRLQVYIGSCGPGLIRRLVRPEALSAAGLQGSDRDFAAHLYEPAAPDGSPPRGDSLGGNDVAVWSHLRNYLATQVLRKVDRMSMAHGLEIRAPFLGSPFAELCLAAPTASRRRGGTGKLPVRSWLARSPLRHVTKGGKKGFAIPVSRWLRRQFREPAEELLFGSRSPLREWLVPGVAADLWQSHLSGRTDARKELWALTVLGSWLRYNEAPLATTT